MMNIKNLSKVFQIGNSSSITVLDQLNFEVPEGSWLSVTGPSGSGKSTLLSIMAGLEKPSQGAVHINGHNISIMSEDDRADFRAKNMAFIFQSFRLMPNLTALENVTLPLELLGQKNSEVKAKDMLDQVGLSSRVNHFPAELSGGEQQRVAIARAFVANPKILFADEPTGNLDSVNGGKVLDLLRHLKDKNNSTLVVVTHDPLVASQGNLKIHLRDGQLVHV